MKPEEFREGIDLEMMYQDLYYASEGFLHECLQRGKLNADDIEKGYQKLIAYWRGVYQR